MHTSTINIRTASPSDAPALLSIYAPYVENTAITFEYTVPTPEDFRERIARTLDRYPYLVAQLNGTVMGYAYASAFHPRAAYDWSAEVSIYVSEDARGSGIGTRLYAALEDILKQQNIVNVNACIAFPNPGSISFHEKLGYQTVGHFTKCGYKLGRWWDMIWMEKMGQESRTGPGLAGAADRPIPGRHHRPAQSRPELQTGLFLTDITDLPIPGRHPNSPVCHIS